MGCRRNTRRGVEGVAPWGGAWLPALLGLGGLVGGLALMTWGLRQATRGQVRQAVAALRRAGPLQALVAGCLLTALLQSSSTFGLLLVGAVAAGWVSLPVARAAIVGANIGTTVTAHLTATPAPALAWTLAAAGLGLAAAGRRQPRWRAVGLAAIGLGAALTGLDQLGRALAPLAARGTGSAPWTHLPGHPWLAFGTGLVAAAGALSSGAVIAVVQRGVSAGLLPASAALPVVYGANVGTTSDVLLAGLLLRGPALSVAWFHLGLNAATAVVAFCLSPLLAAAAAALAADPARQVAWAHTLFNLLSALLAWPWLDEPGPRRPH